MAPLREVYTKWFDQLKQTSEIDQWDWFDRYEARPRGSEAAEVPILMMKKKCEQCSAVGQKIIMCELQHCI